MNHFARQNWISTLSNYFLKKTQKTIFNGQIACFKGLFARSRVLITSFLLCSCLITQSVVAAPYNDMRAMPFVEMMVTMMKIMNAMMGGSNNFSGLNHLPYSPAFIPGMGMGNGLGGFNNLPRSPAGFNALPLNNTANLLQDGFPAGQNANTFNNPGSMLGHNFWRPDKYGQTYAQTSVLGNNTSLNGIWQALSGDVIAIYHNNRFIWTDGNARNLAGHLVIKGNTMAAYIPANNITLKFQFYREPGQFVVRDQTSRIYTFKRIH